MTDLLNLATFAILQATPTTPSGDQLRNAILLVAVGGFVAAIPTIFTLIWQERARTEQAKRDREREDRDADRERQREEVTAQREREREERAEMRERENQSRLRLQESIQDFQNALGLFYANFEKMRHVIAQYENVDNQDLRSDIVAEAPWLKQLFESVNTISAMAARIDDHLLRQNVSSIAHAVREIPNQKNSAELEKLTKSAMNGYDVAVFLSGQMYRKTLT